MRALLINTAFLGDVIFCAPLLENLQLAGFTVDLLTRPGYGALLGPSGQAIEYDKRGQDRGIKALFRLGRSLRGRYDLVLGAHPSVRSGLLAALIGAPQSFGWGPVGYRVRVPRGPRFVEDARALGEAAGIPDRVHQPRIGVLGRRPGMDRWHLEAVVLASAKAGPLLGPSRPAGTAAILAAPQQPYETQEKPMLAPACGPQSGLEGRGPSGAGGPSHCAMCGCLTGLQQPLPPRTLALVPGSRVATKRWPHWAALADTLHAAGHPLLWLGGADEAHLATGPGERAFGLSLPETATLLAGCALAVGGDSGLLHLARAVQTPVVMLFGPTPSARLPPDAGRHDLSLSLPCRPCSPHGPARCPLGHHRCMADLDPLTVGRVIQSALSGERSA